MMTRTARSRLSLQRAMGGRCAMCGSEERLEFDCVERRGPTHHLLPWPQRVRWYWAEYLFGNLQLLCKSCHQRKTCAENSKVSGARMRMLGLD